MRRNPAIGALFLGLWLIPACTKDSPEPLAQVIVELDAEPEVQQLASSLRVEVYGADGLGALSGRVQRLDERVKPIAFPKRVALTPVGGDDRRVFVLAATVYDAHDAFVAQARIVSGYVPHAVRYARLTLEASECLRRQCEDELSTCSLGRCIDARVEASELSSDPDRPTQVRLGEPSAAMDAATDAGTDAGADAGADGGSGPDVIGESGEECSGNAVLSCSEDDIRQPLLCMQGMLVEAERCSSMQRCDPRPGATPGQCVDILPDCLDLMPGDQFCRGNDRMTCGPNLITAQATACPSGEVCVLEAGATRCEPDADECALDQDDCDPVPDACLNVFGGYECECPTGYTGSGQGEDGCVDIEECAADNGGCDQDPMASCDEGIGTPRTCSCPAGYDGQGIGDNGCLRDCSAVAAPCTTPGTRCEGDTLVRCEPDADECLHEVRVDCTSEPNKNICDPSLSAGAGCGVDVCKGVADACTVEGLKHCQGNELLSCASRNVTLYGVQSSCLVDGVQTACAAGYECCDGSADPAACSALSPGFSPQCYDPRPALVTCTSDKSTQPCGSITTATGVSLQLGPYGAVMEPNIGAGFGNTVNSQDTAALCRTFVESFGADPTWTAAVLDLGSLDLALYTIFRPARWTAGESFPVLIWGNGTCMQPSTYGALLRYIASYGFVVIAPNSRYVGSGDALKRAIDFAEAADQDTTSPYFGRLDTAHIGVLGHSQGGSGTSAAASDPRVSVVALLSGSASASKPFLTEAADLDIASTAPQLANAVNAAPKAAYLFFHMVPASSSFEGHLLPARYPQRMAAAVTGWFQYQLEDDTTARALFIGTSCGLCNMASSFEYGQKGL